MAKIRLYPDPGAEGRVGIGIDGELFEPEDAARLIGQGIATRNSGKRRPKKSKKPAPPAKEG